MIGDIRSPLPSLPLPQLVYAQVSPVSVGGVSLFAAPGPITASNVNDYVSESGMIEQVLSQLVAAGFQILQRSPLMINIAAPPALFETFFQTSAGREHDRAGDATVSAPASRHRDTSS